MIAFVLDVTFFKIKFGSILYVSILGSTNTGLNPALITANTAAI
jgi:hypothetical protein